MADDATQSPLSDGVPLSALRCAICEQPMTHMGALLLAPPRTLQEDGSTAEVEKVHIGLCCWDNVEDALLDLYEGANG